ncbi:MAG: DUF72 domain-containing protein [Candidatus Eisenbacteria sp.]|nr:DUF72 domain-containing protein [Candidatus Eisenbacteria bacterium]
MIKVGCCGFGKTRGAYFKKFDLVETKQTFYQVPLPKTARRWKQEAGRNFEFAVRAWQLITHPPESPSYEKLKDCLPPRSLRNYGWFQLTPEVLSAWERTVEVARSLDARVILFESPTGFLPEKTCIDNLTKFFGSIHRENFLMVWEPRSPWPADLAVSLCRGLNLGLGCDPFVQRPLTGTPWYLRLHGPENKTGQYSDRDLMDLCRLVEDVDDAYVLFNNETRLEDAERFKTLLKTRRTS